MSVDQVRHAKISQGQLRAIRCALKRYLRNPMSAPTPPPETHAPDATEAIVPLIPLVLPLVGGVLMFLLAFIAIYMA